MSIDVVPFGCVFFPTDDVGSLSRCWGQFPDVLDDDYIVLRVFRSNLRFAHQ